MPPKKAKQQDHFDVTVVDKTSGGEWDFYFSKTFTLAQLRKSIQKEADIQDFKFIFKGRPQAKDSESKKPAFLLIKYKQQDDSDSDGDYDCVRLIIEIQSDCDSEKKTGSKTNAKGKAAQSKKNQLQNKKNQKKAEQQEEKQQAQNQVALIDKKRGSGALAKKSQQKPTVIQNNHIHQYFIINQGSQKKDGEDPNNIQPYVEKLNQLRGQHSLIKENGIIKLNHSSVRLDAFQFTKFNWRSVRQLNLTACNINDAGWSQIVSNFKNYNTVNKMILRKNLITMVTQAQLAQISLGHIDFGDKKETENPLSDESKKQLANYKKNHPICTVIFTNDDSSCVIY